MLKKIFIALLTTSTLFISACGQEETPPPVQEPVKKFETPVETPTQETSATDDAEKLFAGIEEKINKHLNDDTEYAVYIAYPQKSQTPYIYNSKKMRSASMIKVFILAAALNKANKSELNIDDVITLKSSDKVGGAGILAGRPSGSEISIRELLRLMITESDNTATNILIDLLGFDYINHYIQSNGYHDTILQRKMMDTNAINSGRENFSSVTDLGNIFTKIYQHKCVNENFDNLMLDFLKAQADTDCFPAALPDKIIAHKTGALAGLYDDGGIIFDDDRDTVLVIMTENFVSEHSAIQHMISFTRSLFL